jgi:hypothetical protein
MKDEPKAACIQFIVHRSWFKNGLLEWGAWYVGVDTPRADGLQL